MKEDDFSLMSKNTFDIDSILISENERWYKEIRYEEEEATVPCCIKDIEATAHDQIGIAPSVINLGGGRRINIFKAGQIRMQFRLKVGRKEDVSKISVIQYIKGATMTHNGANQPPGYPTPKDKKWKWKEGSDGCRVDSERNNRCWPEFSATNPIGLIRNEDTRIITWYDEPGLRLDFLKNAMNAGRMKATDFPVEYISSFKTDVICATPKPCGSENPRNRKKFGPSWNNKVVARVTWKVKVKVYAYKLGIWLATSHADNKPEILEINKKIYKECQGAM